MSAGGHTSGGEHWFEGDHMSAGGHTSGGDTGFGETARLCVLEATHLGGEHWFGGDCMFAGGHVSGENG